MIRRFLGLETRAVDGSVFNRAIGLFGDNTAAGKSVTHESALTISAVWGCVRILSENVATLPLDSFRRLDGVRKPFRPRPTWLDFNAGPWNKTDVLGQVMMSLLLDGNAYIAVYRDGDGFVVWLDPLHPSAVEPERTKDGGVQYRINGGAVPLSRMDILHIRGMTMPGSLKGLSPVTYGRETFGLSLAATEFGAAFFGNGAVPGMAVEVPGELSSTGQEALRTSWDRVHRGSGNAHKLAILTEGSKLSKLTINPEEAQFLQTRGFQVSDVARFFGVPPHLIADASNSTSWGSGLLEQNIAFVQHSLRPWVERLEEGFTYLLTSEGRPADVFVKLNVDGLMRGSYTTRIEGYKAGIDAGIYLPEEVRAWEDLPPLGPNQTTRYPQPPTSPTPPDGAP